MDWKRGSRTPSPGTGPDKAKTGTYFLFIETSWGGGLHSGKLRNLDFAILETTTGVLGSGASLNFGYSMNGRSIGALKVKADGKELFEEKGNKGKAWKETSVNLGAFAGSQVLLQIVAIYGGSWSGDIAIDDVTLDVGDSATNPPSTLAPTPAPTLAPTTAVPTLAPTTAAPTLAPSTAAPTLAPTTAPNSASSSFDRIDLDKNNELSRAEIDKALKDKVIKIGLFDGIDKDNNARITSDEFKKAIDSKVIALKPK